MYMPGNMQNLIKQYVNEIKQLFYMVLTPEVILDLTQILIL